MKRPLVVITAGFVLGEVLALCLQEAGYRTFFWLFGLLFFAVLAVRRFWGINLSRSVIYRTLLLFFILFFGGMTAVISIGSYSYCDVGLGFDPLIANIISWILAVTFAYVTNKIWVFQSQTTCFRDLCMEIGNFFGGRLATLGVEELILFVFISRMQWISILVKLIAQVVIVILNYIICKISVFKEKKEE